MRARHRRPSTDRSAGPAPRQAERRAPVPSARAARGRHVSAPPCTHCRMRRCLLSPPSARPTQRQRRSRAREPQAAARRLVKASWMLNVEADPHSSRKPRRRQRDGRARMLESKPVFSCCSCAHGVRMTEAPRPPNPALLMQLALAHRSSAVLFAAVDLDVFTMLAAGPLGAGDLAARCGAHAEPMRLLLEACAAEGLLARENGGYRNTPVVDAFLVKGRPAYSANGFKYA